MTAARGYAVITPARDEEGHLRALAGAIESQTIRPAKWIVVDNGSSDGTPSTLRELATRLPWLTPVAAPTAEALTRGGPIVRAFHIGLDHLDGAPGVVVKLDADITFAEDHFARLLAAFDRDPQLGIASGSCYERGRDGVWRQRHGTGAGVWGANRAYRWECLQEILPLEERMGWDTIDLVKATVRGWRTSVLQDLPFRHHRTEGKRDGARVRSWAIQGRAAHYMGYRFSYLIVRTLYRMLRDPSAIALVHGYVSAAASREPRCADEAVRTHLRRSQRFRRLPQRAFEARRPRTALDDPLP